MQFRLTILISLIFFWGTSYTQVQDPQFMQSKFDKIFNRIILKNQPGGCVLVLRKGKVIYEKCGGLADLNTKKLIDRNTIFNTGSISKTFVAYGILILQQEGKLSIEDPILKYFPDFGNPKLVERVLVKHLLAHCSGLPDVRNVSEQREFYMTANDEGNFDPIKKIQTMNFEPGAQFEYSNPAFNGLALIIEMVSGKPWQDFIQERIFEPAGMTKSVITNGAYPDTGVAHAYDRRGKNWVENDYGEFPTFTAAGNGGVWCSINDLVKYEQAIQAGTFIEKEYLSISRNIFHPGNWKSEYTPMLGMSWFIRTYEDLQVVYHTGSQGGFRAFHGVIPEKDIWYISLFNYPPNDFRSLIDQGLEIFKEAGWLD